MADIKLGNLLYKDNTAPVDDTNPVSVKDEQAKTTLGQIDQRLQTLEDTVEDGLQKVQLNGNNELTETVIERKIRTEDSSRIGIQSPIGAKYALVEHFVHGVTGTFSNDEGFRLESGIVSSTGGSAGSRPLILAQTSWETTPSAGGSTAIVYGASAGIGDGNIQRSVKFIKAPPAPNIRIQIEIAGVFEEGEGVDSEVIVTWLT